MHSIDNVLMLRVQGYDHHLDKNSSCWLCEEKWLFDEDGSFVRKPTPFKKKGMRLNILKGDSGW